LLICSYLDENYIGFNQLAKSQPGKQLKARKSTIKRLDNSPVSTTLRLISLKISEFFICQALSSNTNP